MKRRIWSWLCAVWLSSGAALGSDGSTPKSDSGSAEVLFQTRYQQTAVHVDAELDRRVRNQFPDSSVAAETLRTIRDTPRSGDGLSLHRAFLELDGPWSQTISTNLVLDFARLLDEEEDEPWMETLDRASARLQLSREFAFTVGLFHVPFSVVELVPERERAVAEEGPTHELLDHLRLTGREVGATVEITPLGRPDWLRISGGAFDGAALGGQERRLPGLFAGQVLSQPVEQLSIGAGVVYRPYKVRAWWEELRFTYQAYDKGIAYSAHATGELDALTLRGEWISGDRTDNDVALPLLRRRGDARTFVSLSCLAAWRLKLRKEMALTPVLRVEWLDTDREHPTGALTHATAALNLDLNEEVRVLWDLSFHDSEEGTKNWKYSIVRFDPDYVTGLVQLQLSL